MQLEVLDEESEIGKFDEQDEKWSTTRETSLYSTIVMTLGLMQPSRHNVIRDIKYLEEGKILD